MQKSWRHTNESLIRSKKEIKYQQNVLITLKYSKNDS